MEKHFWKLLSTKTVYTVALPSLTFLSCMCVCMYESAIQSTGKTCFKKVLGSGNLFLASSVLFLNTSFLKGNCFALIIEKKRFDSK